MAILYGPADVLWKEKLVPKLEVEDVGTFEVEEGKRLVLAIEEDAGVDILHDVGPEPQERQRVSLQGRDH